MHLDYFETYLNLVRSGNFHQTAKELGLAQSTVSQHIRKMEEFLGVQLFIRRNSGCEQTPAARRLDSVVCGIKDLVQRARGCTVKEGLVVGASTNAGTYLLQPGLRHFLSQQVAGIDFSLLIDRNDLIIDRLEHWAVDVAVTEWWVEREGFEALLWRMEPLVVITPDDHPLSRIRILRAKDLIGQNLLGGETATGTGRILRKYLGEMLGQLKIKMSLGNTAAVIEGVRNGLGISIVLESAVRSDEQKRGLCVRTLEDASMEKPVYLICRDSLPRTHPARRLIGDLMESRISA
ncbi:MAG: LysR family transcriptional regulator [Opitutales bacterium]|nr:LysR family transcriptional regulator [Opitutales bacterium]